MCNCIDQNQKALHDYGTNTQLDVPFVLNRETNRWECNRVAIVTCKLDKTIRKKPVTLLASYCPFCGEKYAQDGLKKLEE